MTQTKFRRLAIASLGCLSLVGCDNTREEAKTEQVSFDGVVGVWDMPLSYLEESQRQAEEIADNLETDVDVSAIPQIENIKIVISDGSIAMYNYVSSPIGAFAPCYLGVGTELEHLVSKRYRLAVSLSEFVAAAEASTGGGFFVTDGAGFDPSELESLPSQLQITLEMENPTPDSLYMGIIELGASAFTTRVSPSQLGNSIELFRSTLNEDELTPACAFEFGEDISQKANVFNVMSAQISL